MPNANAFAERWIRSVRQECLVKLVLLGEWHVRRVLAAYITFYNTRRPHSALGYSPPAPPHAIAPSPPTLDGAPIVQ